ncbi:DUF7352 domain-containing protein [Desertimonas flava]|uniref:DUF7352 domain-containing protein n=1 Tax=Desertimonas flava TaxID=2064846 RepID=UPI0013C516C2|nr:hypothetical protein [Desertimonas flava]
MSDRVIWKYEIPVDGLTLELAHPRIVHVDHDPTGMEPDLLPFVWIEHGRPGPLEQVEIRFVGTGQPVPDAPFRHVGTAICGQLVWHVYARVT